MRRLNAYYLISIVTLVFMTFMFIRMLQVNDRFEKADPSDTASFILSAVGSYLPVDDPGRSWLVSLQADPAHETWLHLSLDDNLVYALRVSPFEAGEILVEIFETLPSGTALRMDGCELLLAELNGEYSGATVGGLCLNSEDGQEFKALKIFLGKTELRIDIERRDVITETILGSKTYKFSKEVTP